MTSISNPVLDIRNLAYTYPSGEPIFKNLNLQINKGEFVILLGKNGSGKSTLVNLVLGLRYPLSGSVEVLNINPTSEHRDSIFKQLFLNSHDLKYDENSRVGYILDNYRIMYQGYDQEREAKLLNEFGLQRDTSICELSTGMKARVQFIAAICSNTPFILIDEITAVLDREARKKLGLILKEECIKGRTVLMATNIPEDTTLNSNRVVTIEDMEISNYVAA